MDSNNTVKRFLSGIRNGIRNGIEDTFSDRMTLIKIMSVILILLAAVIFRIYSDERADITISTEEESAAAVSAIYVDIGGAVEKPGVYEVAPDTRLYEVIEMAGGLAGNADTYMINQAAYVEDGEKIIIPVLTEASDPQSDSVAQGSSESAGEDAAASADPSVSASSSYSGLVNINLADKEELKTLSGIGDVIAERIIEYRTTTRFRNKEDIKSVKGIGDAVYNKIKDSITV